MHTTVSHLAIYACGILSGVVACWLWRELRRPAPMPATRHQLDRAARVNRIKLATPARDKRAWIPLASDHFDHEETLS